MRHLGKWWVSIVGCLSFLLLRLILKKSLVSLGYMHFSSCLNAIGLVCILKELGPLAFQPYHSPRSIRLSVSCYTGRNWVIRCSWGGSVKDLLSFRRDSSSRRVDDFNCRKFDIKCIKENVENIWGFPVTSQYLANPGNVSSVTARQPAAGGEPFPVVAPGSCLSPFHFWQPGLLIMFMKFYLTASCFA